ncbi:MAG: LacI family DNA-binding transcriptional regulator [Anaerolineales bacterium]|nr:LacI family DNA-binding transcriptional regulator [Anaerolineales bacterium]
MATRSQPPIKRTVTMQDVGERAGVSQSTVSRVLSGSSPGIPISEETRQRVLDAVKELGYYPNLHAGSLRGQKTRMISMMIADIGNPFYHPMVRAVQDIAHGHRYDVIVTNTDHMRENEMLFCESIIRRPVDGVIMVPYHLGNEDIEMVIERSGAAVAVLGQHITHPLADVAFGDDDIATREAVTWLIEEKGHRRIGFIGVTNRFSAGERRRLAFLESITRAQLAFPGEYHQVGDWSPESGERAMRRLLSLPEPPTAVFVCNDLMAIGAIEAAVQAGVRVPEDVAIIGFDDIPIASWTRPRLSTIAQFPAAMGEAMARAIFERIDGEYEGPARRFEFPCKFIEREST